LCCERQIRHVPCLWGKPATGGPGSERERDSDPRGSSLNINRPFITVAHVQDGGPSASAADRASLQRAEEQSPQPARAGLTETRPRPLGRAVTMTGRGWRRPTLRLAVAASLSDQCRSGRSGHGGACLQCLGSRALGPWPPCSTTRLVRVGTASTRRPSRGWTTGAGPPGPGPTFALSLSLSLSLGPGRLSQRLPPRPPAQGWPEGVSDSERQSAGV
jgi:hypothetical protein